MATPFFDLIEELRSLGGAPKVTYPTGDNSYPQTERTIKAKRGAHILALGSAEPDAVRFPNNILTEQVELRSDAQMVEVYRKYEVLPGPFTKKGQEYDPQYGLLWEYTEGEVKNGASQGTAMSDVTPENYIKSELKTYDTPTAALDAFFLTFPSTADIQLPRTLLSLDIVWDTTNGAGSYSETGSGSTSGTDAMALSLTSSGRAQGSASVLGELVPIFSEPWTTDLPVLDLFFFLPNPVTMAAVLGKASTIYSAVMGSSVAVLPWPVFKTKAHTLIVTGQKISLSEEATARSSVSVNLSSVSVAKSEGSGVSQDYGNTVRAVTLPESIHGVITISGGGPSISATASVSASAVIAGGGSLLSATATPTGASGTVSGAVFPTSLGATSPPALPNVGIYANKVDVAAYKAGWSTVRVRCFDFASLSNPQITLVEFGSLTGAHFATGHAALSFIIPTRSHGILAVWINTGTETIPDLSGLGVNTYFQAFISPSSPVGGVANNIVVQLGSGMSPYYALSSAGATGVYFTSVETGIQTDATDVDSGATVSVIQEGS